MTNDPPIELREHRLSVQRTARISTLGAAPDRTESLWIVCHGYGELAAAFIQQFAPIATGRRLIAAPEALSRFYLDREQHQRVGASWMTSEDREAEISDYVAYLDAAAADVMATMTPAPEITVLGFSQGVATAARWVDRGSVVPARLILWGAECPSDIDAARMAKRLPQLEVHMVSGTRDGVVSHDAVVASCNRLTRQGLRCEAHSFAGGHRIDKAMLIGLAG